MIALSFIILLAVLIPALMGEWFSRKVRGKFPPRGEFVNIGKQRIHFIAEGHGRSVLLIHGLNGSLQNFSHSLVRELATDHSVIAIDRPGSGYSAPMRDTRLPAQAKLIAEFIEKKQILKPLVVGHSLGGAIALQLGLDYPDLISGLALIAPLTQVQDEIPEPFRAMTIKSRWLRWLYARTLSTPLGIASARKKGIFIFSPEKIPADFATRGGGFIGLDYKSYSSASSDLVSLEGELEKLSARYPTLKIPVSILYGSGDLVLNHKIHGLKMKTAVPNCDVEVIAGGHMLVITQASRVREFIIEAEKRSPSPHL